MDIKLPALLQETYGCQMVAKVGGEPERCIFNTTSPTLWAVSEQYGKTDALNWLVLQLTYSVAQDKKIAPDEQQLADTARVLYNDFGHLKLSEWLLFFYRFDNGEYEQYYGSFSRRAVYQSVKLFMEQRAEYQVRRAQEEREAREAKWPETAISDRQYFKEQYPDVARWVNLLYYLANVIFFTFRRCGIKK